MIYFDNNATTPILAEVRDAMLPFFETEYGNPNSVHQVGNRARVAIERARNQMAGALGVNTGEIIFTGCGTEANNQAILGALLARRGRGKNVVISAIEHPAVREAARWACDLVNAELRIVPVAYAAGAIRLEPFTQAIDANTVLVSVMYANNETGTILPVQAIFRAAKTVGAWCHSDCVQAFGKLPLKPRRFGADMITLSAHKFHGPKGVGALYLKRGIKIDALLHGGGQESGRRGGTENVALIAAMGKAAELVGTGNSDHSRAIRDYFEARLAERMPDQAQINFRDLPRLPNTSSVQFPGQDGNLLLIKLDQKGLCLSTGAACSSGSLSASKPLLAMGLSEEQATATLRFSFSRLNTKAEVDNALTMLETVLKPQSVAASSRS